MWGSCDFKKCRASSHCHPCISNSAFSCTPTLYLTLSQKNKPPALQWLTGVSMRTIFNSLSQKNVQRRKVNRVLQSSTEYYCDDCKTWKAGTYEENIIYTTSCKHMSILSGGCYKPIFLQVSVRSNARPCRVRQRGAGDVAAEQFLQDRRMMNCKSWKYGI